MNAAWMRWTILGGLALGAMCGTEACAVGSDQLADGAAGELGGSGGEWSAASAGGSSGSARPWTMPQPRRSPYCPMLSRFQRIVIPIEGKRPLCESAHS
jgi:hypothetical protein